MFLGFALLDEAVFDKACLLQSLKEDWGFQLVESEDTDAEENMLYFEVGEVRLAASLMPVPIPNGEAEMRAKRNVQWDKAVEVSKNHKAHIIVTSMSETDVVEESKLFAQLMASVGKMPHVLGLDVAGTVLESQFYFNMAKYYHAIDAIPLYNLVYFGVYSSDKETISAFTLGMQAFKLPEMEIIGSKRAVGDVHEFLFMVANHVITNHIVLMGTEDIVIADDIKISITRSLGVALQGETVKIAF